LNKFERLYSHYSFLYGQTVPLHHLHVTYQLFLFSSTVLVIHIQMLQQMFTFQV